MGSTGKPVAVVATATAVATCFMAIPGVRAQEPTPGADEVLPVVPEFQEIVARVSVDSILASLRTLELLGVKAPGTHAIAEASTWLEARYRSLGYTDVTRHGFDFRTHELQNIIVTKPGRRGSTKYLVIGGHYDTIRGPGANDNGSGVAVILEAARILASVETDLPIRFINFSAEEVGVIGSNAYVQEIVVPREMDILLVLNIDQVGGVAGADNTTVTCERDERPPLENNAASAAYTDTLAVLTRIYTSLETHIAHAWGSDYLPFERAGYVITGFYETDRSRFPHTPDDVVENLDPGYVAEIARATVAAALHFARASVTESQ